MNCDNDTSESIDTHDGAISLKGLPDVNIFANTRYRWYTNEEIASILMKIDSHCDWLTNEVQIRPKSGAIILYSRKQVRYRQDGYCWKKRKNGKTTREDHMKLKVQGIECIYGCYVHSAILPTFHRRCYWLLQNPDIVLVHYLNNPSNDQLKMQTFNPGLIRADTHRQWSDQEIMDEIGSMFGGVDEAYKMLTDSPPSIQTTNVDISNHLINNFETHVSDGHDRVGLDFDLTDANDDHDSHDNKPTSANQNMDVNIGVLFDEQSSQQSNNIVNAICEGAQSLSSSYKYDGGSNNELNFNSVESSSFVNASCVQNDQVISLSKLLNLDFHQTSNSNHINSNQINQDNECIENENSISHNKIEDDVVEEKDLVDIISETQCEQPKNKFNDVEHYVPDAISSRMDSNCSPLTCIYSKGDGMDTLTALPLDVLHQVQQEDLNNSTRDDQDAQHRHRHQLAMNRDSNHIELSACDLLVAHDEEFLDQLADFGLPTLTGSSLGNGGPTSTNDDLKDLILELTSVNSGTITNCDFVSAANQSDQFQMDQLNQTTSTNGILTASLINRPSREHSSEIDSPDLGMVHQQSDVAKTSSADTDWNNIEVDPNLFQTINSEDINKSSKIVLKIEDPYSLQINRTLTNDDDMSSIRCKKITDPAVSLYGNTKFGDTDLKVSGLNQASGVRNNFSRSCSAPSGTNDVLTILDYVPNWANTNGGSKVLIIGKWESIRLERQEKSKTAGQYYGQNYHHQELSKSNSAVHNIYHSCSDDTNHDENETRDSYESKSKSNFNVMFDDISVPATQIQENVLRCYAPLHDVGFVGMRVFLNGSIASDRVLFEYKPLCVSRPVTTTNLGNVNQVNGYQSIVSSYQQYRQQLSPNSIKSGSMSCATSPSSVTPAETKVLTLAENIISAMHKKNLNPKSYQSDISQTINPTKSSECSTAASTTTTNYTDSNCRFSTRPNTLISPRLTSSFDSCSPSYPVGSDSLGNNYHYSLSKLGTSLSLTSRDNSGTSQANTVNIINNPSTSNNLSGQHQQQQQTLENTNNSTIPIKISDNNNDFKGFNLDAHNQFSTVYSNCGHSSKAVPIQHPLSIITDSQIYRNHQSYLHHQQQQQIQSQNMIPSCSNNKSQIALLSHGHGAQNISHDSQTETSSSGLGSILSSSPSSSLHSPLSIAPIDSPCSCGHQSSGTPTSADFCEYFQASAKAEESFSCLTLSDYEQQELYEAAKVIQKAYRIYKGRKRQASDISMSNHKETQPHHRHLHHRLLNLGHLHHAPHPSSYREKEMQAATIIQAYYRRYRQYVHYRQSKQQVTTNSTNNSKAASSKNTSKSQSLSSISSVEENGLLYAYQGHHLGANSVSDNKQQMLQHHQKQLDHQTGTAARRYSQNGTTNNCGTGSSTNETCASFIVESLDISNVSSTAYIDRKRIKTAMVSSLNSKNNEQNDVYQKLHRRQ